MKRAGRRESLVAWLGEVSWLEEVQADMLQKNVLSTLISQAYYVLGRSRFLGPLVNVTELSWSAPREGRKEFLS